MLAPSERKVRGVWQRIRTSILNEAANGLLIRTPGPPEALSTPSSRTYVISPTTIIAAVCLRHRNVRRGLDWTTCWRVSCHPFSRRRLGVMLESHGLQLHSLSSAPSTYLAKGHEARMTVGCPLIRSAAWCPVGKKDNMVLRRSREVCSIFKYLTLLSAYWHNYL